MPGPRRSRGRRTQTQKKEKTLFFSPRYSTYSRIVHLDTPTAAQQSAHRLLEEFNQAKTREKKVRIKRVAVLAASRAKAITQKTVLPDKEFQEFTEIHRIYRKVIEKMRL